MLNWLWMMVKPSSNRTYLVLFTPAGPAEERLAGMISQAPARSFPPTIGDTSSMLGILKTRNRWQINGSLDVTDKSVWGGQTLFLFTFVYSFCNFLHIIIYTCVFLHCLNIVFTFVYIFSKFGAPNTPYASPLISLNMSPE